MCLLAQHLLSLIHELVKQVYPWAPRLFLDDA